MHLEILAEATKLSTFLFSVVVENLNLMKTIMKRNIIEIDRERKRMEARVFQVVRLCEPTST